MSGISSILLFRYVYSKGIFVCDSKYWILRLLLSHRFGWQFPDRKNKIFLVLSNNILTSAIFFTNLAYIIIVFFFYFLSYMANTLICSVSIYRFKFCKFPIFIQCPQIPCQNCDRTFVASTHLMTIKPYLLYVSAQRRRASSRPYLIRRYYSISFSMVILWRHYG